LLPSLLASFLSLFLSSVFMIGFFNIRPLKLFV
jgi:hypothetical protein